MGGFFFLHGKAENVSRETFSDQQKAFSNQKSMQNLPGTH